MPALAASPATRPARLAVPHAPARPHRRRIGRGPAPVLAVSSSSSPSPSSRPSISDRAAAAARDFAERHKLKERATAALVSTATVLAAAARDADERLGVSTKARRFAQDAARYAPTYRRRVRAFMAGPAGPPALALSLALLAYFGLLGRLLNFLLLLWWAAPLVMLPLSAAAARRAQAEAEAEAAARRAAGPFGAWGRAARGGGGGGRAGGGGSGGSGGPVIDVDFDVLDGGR